VSIIYADPSRAEEERREEQLDWYWWVLGWVLGWVQLDWTGPWLWDCSATTRGRRRRKAMITLSWGQTAAGLHALHALLFSFLTSLRADEDTDYETERSAVDSSALESRFVSESVSQSVCPTPTRTSPLEPVREEVLLERPKAKEKEKAKAKEPVKRATCTRTWNEGGAGEMGRLSTKHLMFHFPYFVA
jgi:hypothetical protein